jgi:hypothetical protein
MQETTLIGSSHNLENVKAVPNPGPLQISSGLKNTLIFFVLLGIAAFIAAIIVNPQRAWYSFLLNHFFFLCLGLAGVFFTALQYATRSTWSVAVRRVAEGLTAYLPVAAILSVLLIIGAKYLYSWTFPTLTTEHPLHYEGEIAPGGRLSYLNLPMFSLRTGVFLLIWMAFGIIMVRNSLRQDTTSEENLSKKNIKLATAFLPIFAFTFTMACVDMLMSLEPRWYSTIFGVYCFAGLFQAGLAFIIILVIKLKRSGPLAGVVNPAHLKDLGGLLFAFSVFMAYIGFSQFMLQWYANMPEETFWFMRRLDGNWLWLALILPFFKFVIPFFGLLSQDAKRSEKRMLFVSTAVLIGCWLDVYWTVVPVFKEIPSLLSWAEIGIGLGFAGLFGLSLTWFFKKNSILPVGDPRIKASVNWQG